MHAGVVNTSRCQLSAGFSKLIFLWYRGTAEATEACTAAWGAALRRREPSGRARPAAVLWRCVARARRRQFGAHSGRARGETASWRAKLVASNGVFAPTYNLARSAPCTRSLQPPPPFACPTQGAYALSSAFVQA